MSQLKTMFTEPTDHQLMNDRIAKASYSVCIDLAEYLSGVEESIFANDKSFIDGAKFIQYELVNHLEELTGEPYSEDWVVECFCVATVRKV
jgi:hypothetical protein